MSNAELLQLLRDLNEHDYKVLQHDDFYAWSDDLDLRVQKAIEELEARS